MEVEVGVEKYRNAKTSVWWDIDICKVPDDGSCIAHNINSALRNMDYSGPISIFAYGDIKQIPKSAQQSLSTTGITLNQVPTTPGASIKRIMVDMLFWAADNPAPANFLIISGDCDISYALDQLRARRYNILLAKNASATLVAEGKSVRLWTSILAGGPSTSDDELVQSGNYNNRSSCSMTKTLVAGSVQINHSGASDSTCSENYKAYCYGNRGDIASKGKQIWRERAENNMLRKSSVEVDIPCQKNGGNSVSKGKQIWRKSSETNMLRTTNVNIDIQGQSNGGPQQRCSPQVSLAIAPHEFFTASKYAISSSSYPVPSHFDSSVNNGKDLADVSQYQLTQCNSSVQHNFAPDRFFDQHQFTQKNLSVQSNFAPHNFFIRDSLTHGPHPVLPTSNEPTVTSSARTHMMGTEQPDQHIYGESSQNSNFESLSPDSLTLDYHTGQNIPSCSIGPQNSLYHRNCSVFPDELSLIQSSHPLCSNGIWGTPGCPEPSNYVQGLIGIVLLALHTLQSEKLVPTEANIADCIRYGDPMHRNIDVRTALNYAIEHQMIVMHSLGALQIYIGRNARIWKCVNPIGGSPRHYPKAMWNDIQNYLSSPDGQFKMMASECRYEAATFLKSLCLKSVALGDVLQILNMIIDIKRWITIHPSGWQPISITFSEIAKDAVDADSV